MSSRGSITYGVAKGLSYIIKPLVGQFPHYVKIPNTLFNSYRAKGWNQGRSSPPLMSRLFFTSVPLAPSIQIVKQRVQQDPTLPQRINMSILQIITFLEFCLTNTYFLIANLFMEEFKVKALSTCPHPPSLWLRFVDDTFVINKVEHSQALLQHINNQDPHIQFIVEPTQQSSLPFPGHPSHHRTQQHLQHHSLQEATHRDQYLHWDSNYHITARQSVCNMLAHRAKVVSSSQDRLDQELQHIK